MILAGIVLALLAGCSGGTNANTPEANTPPAIVVPVDPAGAAQVTREMLEKMLQGDVAAMREFFVQKERLAGNKADALTFNPDGKMTGYELGEPVVEGELTVVPATIKFKDGVPEKTYQVVLKREGDQWRVSIADTVKRTLFGKKDKDDKDSE
jgi:hypothetical protein